MTTDQDYTVFDTNSAGETADTKPTGVVELTGAIEPIGVATLPTKEESNQDDKDDANATDHRENRNDCQYAHFEIDE